MYFLIFEINTFAGGSKTIEKYSYKPNNRLQGL